MSSQVSTKAVCLLSVLGKVLLPGGANLTALQGFCMSSIQLRILALKHMIGNQTALPQKHVENV